MVVIVSPQYKELVKDHLQQAGETYTEIGEVVDGTGIVKFK